MEKEVIKAKMIDTGKGCFISESKKTYNQNHILRYLYFDGNQPKESYKADWLYIPNRPTKIQRMSRQKYTNYRWELNRPEMKGKLLDCVPKDYSGDDYDLYFDEEGDFKLEGFYNYKYDSIPSELEDVEVEWELIMEVENFKEPPRLCFEGIKRIGWNESVYQIRNENVKHYAMDEMIIPPVLIHNRPCYFTSKQVYDITRQYVKEHIDLRVAKISSDYDFCFEVQKLIPLHQPKQISYQNLFAKTKKERQEIHTSTVKYRDETTVLEMTSEEERHKGYTPIPKMCANSEEELQQKMQEWLDYVISEINKPLIECPHCKGLGIVEWNGEKVKFKKEEE